MVVRPKVNRLTLDGDVDIVRDRDLVKRAQAGDKGAFDELYRRYYGRVLRFCRKRLDCHESEDVFQDSFARAWRSLPNFDGDRRFYPWLIVIADHRCMDLLRRRKRSETVSYFDHPTAILRKSDVEESGEQKVIRSAEAVLVAKAFQRLSVRHQRVLQLREGLGWPYKDIAVHENLGTSAVEALLFRARQALKREFAAIAAAEDYSFSALAKNASCSVPMKKADPAGRLVPNHRHLPHRV